jgi:hypothetical protein
VTIGMWAAATILLGTMYGIIAAAFEMSGYYKVATALFTAMVIMFLVGFFLWVAVSA